MTFILLSSPPNNRHQVLYKTERCAKLDLPNYDTPFVFPVMVLQLCFFAPLVSLFAEHVACSKRNKVQNGDKQYRQFVVW